MHRVININTGTNELLFNLSIHSIVPPFLKYISKFVLAQNYLKVYYNASVQSQCKCPKSISLHACMKGWLTLDTTKHEEVAICTANQRIPNVYGITRVFEENGVIRSIMIQLLLLTLASYYEIRALKSYLLTQKMTLRPLT